MRTTNLISVSVLGISLTSFGCTHEPVNASFPVTTSAADQDLARLRADKRRLQRPLVIVTGFMDPGIAAVGLGGRMQALFDDDRIVTVTLGGLSSLDDCRDKVLAAVQKAFPSNDPTQTAEVDVIGYSLGGLVARYAALPVNGDTTTNPTRPRLNIARLFTISTPHRGADDANRWPLLMPLQKSLRPGSDDLNTINAAIPTYPIYPYVVLDDRAIGPSNAAPPGQTAWWVPTRPFTDPHNNAFEDPRILTDIALRLRGETPLTTDPPAGFP